MSGTLPDLDLREQIGRIDRMRDETLKFVAETRKLDAEAAKLRAEERKLGWDRRLSPWLAIVGLVGGVITVLSALARWRGVAP